MNTQISTTPRPTAKSRFALIQHLTFDTREDAHVVLDHYRDVLDAIEDHVWQLVTPARRAGVLASVHPEAAERTAVRMALAVDELAEDGRPLRVLSEVSPAHHPPRLAAGHVLRRISAPPAT